jgi:hypothetical protein
MASERTDGRAVRRRSGLQAFDTSLLGKSFAIDVESHRGVVDSDT